MEEEETKPNICRKHTHTHVWCSRETHKLEQEGVFSQSSDAAGEAEDEHHSADYDEEPHGVEATQVRDGRQVRQHALRKAQALPHRGNRREAHRHCDTKESKRKGREKRDWVREREGAREK